MSHFMNGVKCPSGHAHGFSCAIDSFLEVYNTCYQFEPSLSSVEKHKFIQILNEVCALRRQTNAACCSYREKLWNYLVLNMPVAFAPKGRPDAEILSAFQLLGSKDRQFSTFINAQVDCHGCNQSAAFERTFPTIILTQTQNMKSNGNLAMGIELELHRIVASASKVCVKCHWQRVPSNMQVSLPSFLVIELGLENFRNCQKPPISVSENMTIFGVHYTLRSAVLMEPQHFFAVVNRNGGFTVLDGLNKQQFHFSTFGGAVSRNVFATSRSHNLSPSQHGVHILVFQRVKTNPVANTPVPGPSTAPRPVANQTNVHGAPVATNAQRLVQNPTLPNGYLKEKPTQIHSDAPNGRPEPQICRNIKLDGNTELKIYKSGSREYLCCVKFFSLSEYSKTVARIGYSTVDSKLKSAGLKPNEHFLFQGNSRKRTHISLDASLVLLDGKSGRSKDLHVFLKEKLCSPETKPTPKLSNSEPKGKNQKQSFKTKVQKLKMGLRKICEDVFGGNKQELLKGLTVLIKSNKKMNKKRFSGYFSKSDVLQILMSVPGSKTVQSQQPTKLHGSENQQDQVGLAGDVCSLPGFTLKSEKHHQNSQTEKKSDKNQHETLLDEICREKSGPIPFLSAEDLIYLEENLSGTRLVQQLRKKLPGVLASYSKEMSLKRQYFKEFRTILLPRRIATGWQIDPFRLLEVLSFMYYWLEGEKHYKIYGDGREIGGRHSTFISVNILNTEACFYNVKHQNPKEVHPISIFYESDSRDNLEQNIGQASTLNKVIEMQQKGSAKFYLTGDEMFLEAILDGSGTLSPTSKRGWNIYHEDDVSSKQQTSPNTGLRTDLGLKIDRQHPESILPAIPIERTVFCLLHALARCVEKLLTLVVQSVINESHKASQRGEDGPAYLADKINNLENNINARGVRQGGFRIRFDKNGQPEPISLNKDHAWTIIHPSPREKELEYPSVLSNVLSRRKVRCNLPDHVRTALDLHVEYSELNIVQLIWDNFFHMIDIIKKDPLPELLPEKPQGSHRLSDYSTCKVSEADIKQYILHAEVFYQLMVVMYGSGSLTPYMIKLIDHVPSFLKELPFPISRFQSEGGEHANYLHNCFYYNHTTRHGGRNNPDPLLAIFSNMWKRISYNITLDTSEDGKNAASNFSMYKKMHMSACVIQCVVRGWLVRVRLEREGWKWKPKGDQDKLTNRQIALKYVASLNTELPKTSKTLFNAKTFLVCGTVPKFKGKKLTQGSFKQLIKDHGGKTTEKLPGCGKGISTKPYTVLFESTAKKLPNPVRSAARKGFVVLSPNYITDCIQTGELLDDSAYRMDLKSLCIAKPISLSKKHFRRKKTMTSEIKKIRAPFQPIKTVKAKNPAKNAAVHYVLKRRKQMSQLNKMSFKQGTDTLCSLHKEWKQLPQNEKENHYQEWLEDVRIKKSIQEKEQKRLEDLQKYNRVINPAYNSFMFQ